VRRLVASAAVWSTGGVDGLDIVLSFYSIGFSLESGNFSPYIAIT